MVWDNKGVGISVQDNNPIILKSLKQLRPSRQLLKYFKLTLVTPVPRLQPLRPEVVRILPLAPGTNLPISLLPLPLSLSLSPRVITVVAASSPPPPLRTFSDTPARTLSSSPAPVAVLGNAAGTAGASPVDRRGLFSSLPALPPCTAARTFSCRAAPAGRLRFRARVSRSPVGIDRASRRAHRRHRYLVLHVHDALSLPPVVAPLIALLLAPPLALLPLLLLSSLAALAVLPALLKLLANLSLLLSLSFSASLSHQPLAPLLAELLLLAATVLLLATPLALLVLLALLSLSLSPPPPPRPPSSERSRWLIRCSARRAAAASRHGIALGSPSGIAGTLREG